MSPPISPGVFNVQRTTLSAFNGFPGYDFRINYDTVLSGSVSWTATGQSGRSSIRLPIGVMAAEYPAVFK